MVSGAMTTTAVVAGGLASIVFFVWPLAMWLEVRRLEKPKYTVLQSLGAKRRFVPPIEVRKYAPYLVAEVVFDKDAGDMKNVLSQGFRQIAGFIFGGNTAKAGDKNEKVAMTSPVVYEEMSEKIAMTSPVAAEMDDNGKSKVAFVMPSKYTKESLPKPKNENVTIREVPPHVLAAISWRGSSPREKEMQQKKLELIAALRKANIPVDEDAPVKVYQYYPPFAPGWLRLNEVLLPVKVDDSSAAGTSTQ